MQMTNDHTTIYNYLKALPRNHAGKLNGGYNWHVMRDLIGRDALEIFGDLVEAGWMNREIIPNTYGHTAYTFNR